MNLTAMPIEYNLTARIKHVNPVTLRDLLSWWEYEENLLDSNRANHLTNNNGVTYEDDGLHGHAAAFESDDEQYLSLADNADFGIGDGAFTMGLWIEGFSIAGSYAGSGRFYDLMTKGAQEDGNLEFAITAVWKGFGDLSITPTFTVSYDGTNITNVNSIQELTSGWNLILVWHDPIGNTINISVNNETVCSESHTTGMYNGTADLVIGARDGYTDRCYDGNMDDVFVTRSVMTAAERSWLYNSGLGRGFSKLGTYINLTALPIDYRLTG